MTSTLVQMTATLVASQLSHSRTDSAGVKGLIIEVYETLAMLDAKSPAEETTPERERAREEGRVRAAAASGSSSTASPAIVPHCGSVIPPLNPRWPGVSRDAIVCLEDQVPTVLLKPHLRRHFGMTPDQYRAKWSLPPDYPMAAPSYVDRKREIALRDGLGTVRRPGGRPVVPQPAKRLNGTLGVGYATAN